MQIYRSSAKVLLMAQSYVHCRKFRIQYMRFARNGRISRGFATSREHSRGAPFNLKPKLCYYKTLNVSTAATQDEVKQAFQKLVKRLHPDVNPDASNDGRFKEVLTAYEILSDKGKREMYDTSIGIFDPDWGNSNSENARFWSGDHQAMMEEEIKRFREGGIDARLRDPFKSDYGKQSDLKLTDAFKKVANEAASDKNAKEREKIETIHDHLTVDGQKQSAEDMYEYFRMKYIKNPDIETVDPKAKLKFTKKLYNTVYERTNQVESDMETFSGHSGSFSVHKDVEARYQNPNSQAFRRSMPFLVICMAFMILYGYSTSSQVNKNQLTSTRITHGEGYIQKMTPT
jgi:curved DNA-binding protein CbpA